MRCAAFQRLPEEQAKTAQKNLLSDGATVELIPEGGGLFTVSFCFPDAPDPAHAAGASGAKPAQGHRMKPRAS